MDNVRASEATVLNRNRSVLFTKRWNARSRTKQRALMLLLVSIAVRVRCKKSRTGYGIVQRQPQQSTSSTYGNSSKQDARLTVGSIIPLCRGSVNLVCEQQQQHIS